MPHAISCLTKIVSGGQTGADRAGFEAAREVGLAIGGWAPRGWRAEDGIIPLVYRQFMRESVSPEYKLRTRLNVQDSDATLLVSFADKLTGGSKFTADTCKHQCRPAKHLVLPRGRGIVPAEVTEALWAWIEEHKIFVLNIAGPRETKEPGLQAAATRAIVDLFSVRQRAACIADVAFMDAREDALTTFMRRLLPKELIEHEPGSDEWNRIRREAIEKWRGSMPMPPISSEPERIEVKFDDMPPSATSAPVGEPVGASAFAKAWADATAGIDEAMAMDAHRASCMLKNGYVGCEVCRPVRSTNPLDVMCGINGCGNGKPPGQESCDWHLAEAERVRNHDGGPDA